ncbi:hypothetical protein D9613_003467 [Agrocybe pediades]|uniref:G domain-containing protein n=1 Tax=Agrocybe pediades TaxID=84607 RepID=A0A8H4VNQ7_9AGAR|nr:hypothetical protein D9613_003467 [Agrocybe pediades]
MPSKIAMSIHSRIRQDDIVILIMGITGTGKSTLIDHLATGQPGTIVRAGDGLTSCTQDVAMFVVNNHFSNRIILVDTPGFGDTNRTDMEVLENISNFLADLYRNNISPHGIIYTHRITDNRMSEAQCRALRCFHRLCGDYACSNILFVTTMWDEERSGKRAEEMQRCLREKYWRDMISLGASTTPYWNTPQSALETLKNFVGRRQGLSRIPLQIQLDIVDKRLTLGETEAARALQPPKVAVLLLGLTGAGKSTFVNTAAESSRARVGQELTSTSICVERFLVDHPRKLTSLIFVDPPGLDHTSVSDGEVVKKISESLGALNRSLPDALFGGVIYLHDISESRTQSPIGTTILTLLSVPEPSKHILLATTKWNKAMTDPEENNSRHLELVNGAWKQIRERGALVGKFEDPENSESAWGLVDLLLDRQPLDLQLAHSELNALQEKLRTLTPQKRRGFFTKLFKKLFGR